MKRVLITGGGSGLGRELAIAWSKRGAKVAIADVNDLRLTETRQLLRGESLSILLDVQSDSDWQVAADQIRAEWGGLDVLVNNAGIACGGPLERESMANWERAVSVNLLGVVRGCKTLLPLLRESAGAILNVSSMSGLIHPPMMASYNAVKAAVVALSESLRFELDDSVSVHVLCPGFFKTNLLESVSDDMAPTKALMNRLFEKAEITAAQVAECAVDGVENGDYMILSHPEGKKAFRLKRLFPDSLYPKIMKKQTSGMTRAWQVSS